MQFARSSCQLSTSPLKTKVFVTPLSLPLRQERRKLELEVFSENHGYKF
jgi:hypothetical protein